MDPSISRSTAIEALDAFIRALNSGGVDDLKRSLADDVRWVSDIFEAGDPPAGQNDVSKMLDEFKGAFARFAIGIPALDHVEDKFPEPPAQIPPGAVIFEEGRAAFEFEVVGTRAGFLPGVGTTGRDTNFRGSAIVMFDAGARILMLRTNWNCGLIMGQLGRRAYARPGVVPA